MGLSLSSTCVKDRSRDNGPVHEIKLKQGNCESVRFGIAKGVARLPVAASARIQSHSHLLASRDAERCSAWVSDTGSVQHMSLPRVPENVTHEASRCKVRRPKSESKTENEAEVETESE